MLRLFGLLIGLAWVFVGWRNLPRMTEPSALTAGVAIALTCWSSYMIGRTQTRAQATAVAQARADARAASAAEASSTSVGQMFVNISPEDGARAMAGDLSGLDRAEWIEGPRPVVEQDLMESIQEDISVDEAVHHDG